MATAVLAAAGVGAWAVSAGTSSAPQPAAAAAPASAGTTASAGSAEGLAQRSDAARKAGRLKARREAAVRRAQLHAVAARQVAAAQEAAHRGAAKAVNARKPVAKPKPGSSRPAPGSSSPGGQGSASLSAAERQVLALVNSERAKAGCAALKANATLNRVAGAHSKDMAVQGYFSHTSQDGRSPFDRMKQAGYQGSMMAENIAAGQATAAAVMNAWMNSSGHRQNILNCGYKEIGIGLHRGGSMRTYWTQNFGTR